METQNLQAASDYTNSLLLARGLLRNGKPIPFAGPQADEDGDDSTAARVINLVHDLVTRRDREAEQRENLASTIRTLRNTEAKQTTEIERLEEKTNDLSRSVALAEGQERAFKTTIREAEATNRLLKEQVQRMKTSIQQIRGQCANDLRKRDAEIQRLKSHLVDRQRGKKEGLGVTTVTVVPPPKNAASRRNVEGGEQMHSPGYSLKQETTEFLTQLCQNLSDENDSLISNMKDCIQTLKSLQGLPDVQDGSTSGPNQSVHGSSGQSNSDDNSQLFPPPQHEILAGEIEYVLEQLRSLLNNPSFVPLEEVELRDSEILRLRDGWEEMQARWREAVSMMDNWHKRISNGGSSIDINELKKDMGFGSRLACQGNSVDNTNNSDDVELSDRGVTDRSSQSRVPTDPVSTETSISRSHISTKPLNTLKEESSRHASPTGSRRTRKSMEKSQTNPDEDSDDDLVLVDEPNLVNVQRRRSKRQPESKSSKQAPITKPTRVGRTAPRRPVPQSHGEERKPQSNKKRSSSSRQIGQRTRRRTNSFGPTELKTRS